MTTHAISLDDKYALESGDIYITGSQALVRLPMMQLARDRADGLNTACFISGYRGSPMHNYDKELWRARRYLDGGQIHFQPAVNEDLGATSLWGTQQAALMGSSRNDGVFGIWYGKGPGLDRSMDAIRHANMSGTSKHGGVLAIVGDDHAMTSTDVPATCEPTFMDLMMPVLYPGTVAELLELSLIGIAMSRYCGAWVGIKAVSDTLDAVSTVSVDPRHPSIVLPNDFEFPPDGVHIREPDPWTDQEPRLRRVKIPAAAAFARANKLNRVIMPSRQPRIGIIASGKSAFDTREALRDLGIDAQRANELGIALFQVSMPFPIDAETLREFADGLDEVLVVEEKRRIVETQLKDALYALPDGRRPRVVGHTDENGQMLLPEVSEFGPTEITRVIYSRIKHFFKDENAVGYIAHLDAKAAEKAALEVLDVKRTPYFCSGCPHNTSTRVPEGSVALGGVGCHFMATNMERDNFTHTHMGGEGANWIGAAPYVDRGHIFQNMGDGTYFHSGLLAVRACVAANVNITYKILFNDAVAMTGGQPVDGVLNPSLIAQQVRAEGVDRITVVSDDLSRTQLHKGYPSGIGFRHRDDLDAVQRELREVGGVSVLIYDQTCAAEKRRRRKRGDMVDPARRAFINHRVCEGCGDCSTKSNCLSVVPIETPFGKKRKIDQSSCNKDYSCVNGFCPSFVTVVGGKPRKRDAMTEVPSALRLLPEPKRPDIDAGDTYNILVTGIGGTGVVTVGAMITMAAHLEGRACSSVDQFGMAQKGGAVTSHIRIAAVAQDIRTVRLTPGSADLLLGCDSLVASSELALDTLRRDVTRALVNTHQAITGQFTRNPDLLFPTDSIEQRLTHAAGNRNVDFVDATRLATLLLGDAILSNLFMLGFAYQRGTIPVSAASIEQALEMNGVAIEANKNAFMWGRRAAVDLNAVIEFSESAEASADVPATLEAFVESRGAELVRYADGPYAERYRALVRSVREAEARAIPGSERLSWEVARGAFRLMAVKDEYEVARLYTDGSFERAVEEAFEGDYILEYHFAPPTLDMFSRGEQPTKRQFGPWMLRALKLLARMKGLRGTWLDPFRFNPERATEQALVTRYSQLSQDVAKVVERDSLDLAVELLSAFDAIRGYGHIKDAKTKVALEQVDALEQRWRERSIPSPTPLVRDSKGDRRA
jgi:indolepyruvate ferredoxin oxidoreductase